MGSIIVKTSLPGFNAERSLRSEYNYHGHGTFESIDTLIVPAAPTPDQCRRFVCPACRDRGQACGWAQWCEDHGYCWL